MRHPRGHHRDDIEPDVHVQQPASSRHQNRFWLSPLLVLFRNRHVGGVAERTVRSEGPEESADTFGIGGITRREDAAINQRQVALLRLSPLPRHAAPEPPVVIVIPGAAVERDALAADIQFPAQHS